MCSASRMQASVICLLYTERDSNIHHRGARSADAANLRCICSFRPTKSNQAAPTERSRVTQYGPSGRRKPGAWGEAGGHGPEAGPALPPAGPRSFARLGAGLGAGGNAGREGPS